MGNVVSIEKSKKKTKKKKATGVEARWPGRLSKEQFVPVSSYFLANYHRLRPHPGAAGLTSTEAMLIIQILDHKWSEKAPFPSIGRLADRMGMGKRHIRNTLKRLGELGYVRRVQISDSSTNRFYFEGLYEALEELMDQDVAAADAEEEEEL